LKPESLEKLKAVLTYHVVAGKFDAATVVMLSNKTTENILLLPHGAIVLLKKTVKLC
jgi:uncharacterized surface protein with fasciclin (FAS1) repeats